MALKIKPGAYLRRGRSGVSAETAMYLLEHKDELEAMYDGFDARRDGVIEAMKASDTRLGEFDTMDALKADMAEREADYAARVETLAAAEAEVERRVAVLNNVQVEFDKIWNEEN